MFTQQAEVMHSYDSPTVRASGHADSVKVSDLVSVRHPAVALTAACGVRLYCHTAWRSACGLLGQARQGCSEDSLWTKVASPDLKPNSSTRKTGGPIHRRGGGGDADINELHEDACDSQRGSKPGWGFMVSGPAINCGPAGILDIVTLPQRL